MIGKLKKKLSDAILAMQVGIAVSQHRQAFMEDPTPITPDEAVEIIRGIMATGDVPSGEKLIKMLSVFSSIKQDARWALTAEANNRRAIAFAVGKRPWEF